MMYKKTLSICVLTLFCCTFSWAAGSRDGSESRTAIEPGGFTDSIDISGKKPGKYNFYLEATDKAGNVSYAGPDNIFIDPESDLPLATIINPLPNMRVQGNLNIVGIAMDDDDVSYVEFAITKGRDGKGEEITRIRAQGSEYWSYFLDTTNGEIWTDGAYTITAWAVDINGLSGIADEYPNGTKVPVKAHKKHQVSWNLDRKKPESIITSHEVGALVSGNVRLRGTVNDGNGIDSFSYSIDGGNRYIPARTSFDRRTGTYNWDISINTARTFSDGPAVIWFQATDGQGSLGTAAHLLFVNNTGPDVQIVYPQPAETVNGIFTVAGSASHPVGLRSVSWKADKQSGEFDMVKGNSWWSTQIDLRGVRASNIEVEIRAVDVSGNVTVKKQRYKVDQNADLPIVTLTEPSAGVVLGEDGRLVVKGTVTDDDGVSSVFYSLGGGETVEIPCVGNFQFLISDIAEGTYNLDVWAKDITGVTGPKVQVKGIVAPVVLPEPRIMSFTTGARGAVPLPFYTGMTIQPEHRSMEFTIKASALASASVAFGDMSPVPVRTTAGRDGLFRATVQVPALDSGFTKIELHATDRLGRDVVYNEYIFMAESFGMRFTWIRPNMTADGRILLGSNDEQLLGLSGQGISRAALNGEGSENFNVEVDEYGRVILQARREGNFGPFTMSVGGVESPPFNILADFTASSLILRDSPNGKWVKTNVPISLNVSGRNKVNAVIYSVDMGLTWHNLLNRDEIAELEVPVNIDIVRTIDLSAIQDGTVNILLRVVNESGRFSQTDFTVLKDTRPPAASLIMPVTDSRVNGTIRLGFAIQEAGKLKSISYTKPASAAPAAVVEGQEKNDSEESVITEQTPGIVREVFRAGNWDRDYAPMFFEVLMDSMSMPLDNTMRFIFEDEAGNSSEVSYWPFVIDTQMDIPEAHVILPIDNEVITTDFIVSGVMFDDDAIKQIYWKIDDNVENILVAENGFSIPISISSLTDNEHTITVIAEDIYGVKSEPVTRNFRVSLSEPSARIVTPAYDAILRDVVSISGTASDNNGIEGLQISVDNGNTYNSVFGQEEWNYQFNTKILKDGPHVVFIRVWDNYGIPATYSSMINVDNTPPEIVLDSPGDGSISTGKVSMMGRSIDPNLDAITIELRSLEGIEVQERIKTRKLETGTLIREVIDFYDQEDGLYNIEIVANDKAGNITRVSRNVQLARESMKNHIAILYPLENEKVQGTFNLYGYTGGTDKAKTVSLRVNGIDRLVSDVEDSGYFRFSLDSSVLNTGDNRVVVHSNFGSYETVESKAQGLLYNPDGPWVTIDSMNVGDFAFERPYLYGRMGYALSAEDEELLADRSTDRELRDLIRAKVSDYTEISFDNGKTFVKAGRGTGRDMDYRYRLETGDMAEGMHYILVRATMKNGETAITRMLVQVDKTNPVIKLISPEAGGRYNEKISYSASATDDVELVSLNYYLRPGDKAAYEIPGFLQGLYIEGIIPPFIRQLNNDAPVIPFGGGATYFDVGLGLSFFDDNVKVQVQYGLLTQQLYEALGGIGPVRYGGHVLGIKLLASLYSLPFGSFAGPDWEWLSASFAIGANFSLFDLGREGYTQSGQPTWMSALLMQIEFPKVTIPKWKYFRTFSLFTEGQLWFVPTDVDASANNIETIIPHIIMGVRMYVF